MKDEMTLKMVFKVAEDMNLTIWNTLAFLDMNGVSMSEEVLRLGEAIGLFDMTYREEANGK
jgi:hypothetical protein